MVQPIIKKTFDTLSSGLISCKKNGIKDVIITLWGGDDGTENNYFSALLGIQYAAEHCYRSDVKMEDLKNVLRLALVVIMTYLC